MSDDLQDAILKTLAYTDIFDYPLTTEEIKKYLIRRLPGLSIEETLSQMVANSKLIYADNFYCLPGRRKIINLRKRRQLHSQPKLKKAKRVALVLKFIPWIKLIGVTGALSVENCAEDDDIDLVIITAAGRLWLTRGLVATLLRLTGQYRRPGKIKDKICPNLMLAEDALEFPDRDFFTAHEIVQMKPVFERDNMYQKFLKANFWVKEFLPNAIAGSKFKVQNEKFNPKFKVLRSLLDPLEKVAYRLQLKYMEGKKTIEVTTPSVIRFHPQDARRRVLDEYQKRVYTLTK